MTKIQGTGQKSDWPFQDIFSAY